MLKEFYPTTTLNKKTLIYYFQEKLCLFIQAWLKNWGYDLDMWNKIIEKAVNKKVKVSAYNYSLELKRLISDIQKAIGH